MPRPPHRPAPLRWRVFRGSDALARGLLTRDQLRGLAWVRVRHDVYADSRMEQDHGLACQAVALRLPSGVALAGPSAAFLYGVDHAAGYDDEVHVLVGPQLRLAPIRGVRVHRAELLAGDVVSGQGPVRTAPLRTAWDLASWRGLEPAVTTLDALLRLGVVDQPGLRQYVQARAGQRGGRRAARVFALADGRAQSVPESQLRVRLARAGLPAPVPQYPVRLPAAVYHPDLAWPEYRVAVEYDGHWHGDPQQLHRDRRRLNQLTAAGWTVLHATSQRLYRDFSRFVAEVRGALAANGAPVRP